MRFQEFYRIVSETHRCFGTITDEETEINDVAFFDANAAPYSDSILYFVYSEQYAKREDDLHYVVICSEPEKEAEGTENIIFTPRETLGRFFNDARKTFERSQKQDYYDSVMQQLQETGDIDAVIDSSALFFGGSLILCDPRYRILAYSNSIPVTDSIWKENIEKGFCDYGFIQEVRAMEVIRLLRVSNQTLEVTCSASPMRKYCSSIFYKGNLMGFLLLIENDGTVGVNNTELLSTLSGILSYWIPRYAANYLPMLETYQETLYQLLIGNNQNVPGDLVFPPVMSVRFLYGRKQDRIPAEAVFQEQLRILNPAAYSVRYSEGFVIISPEFEIDDLALLEMCDKLSGGKAQIKLGVSNPFSDIREIHSAFLEAKKAVEIGRVFAPDEAVFRYEEWNLYHLFKASDKREVYSLIHPAIVRIKSQSPDADPLLQTLSVFLDTGESIKNTADMLYMHRNSIQYRLNRIEEIGKIHLNDPQTRFHLRISFVIMKYLSKYDLLT